MHSADPMCELVSQTSQLAPALLRSRIQENMITFLLKKSKMRDLYSSLAARVCRNFKPTDLPLKLLERDTATEKVTAGQRSSQDLFDSETAGHSVQKIFLTTEPLQPCGGPGAGPVHRDFAMCLKISHT